MMSGANTVWGQIIGQSQVMRTLLEQAQRAAAADTWVLIEGEPGSGKSLLAECVHQASPRRGQTFCPVDCRAMPPQTIETEIFGNDQRAGALECSSGGTLFLKHVDDLPLRLQERLFEALTSARCRVIASTARDLEREMARGKFLGKLAEALTPSRLSVPPLRERGGDVALLTEHFARQFQVHGVFDDPVVSALQGHSWPNNVAELRSVVSRSSERNTLLGGELPASVDDWAKGTRPAASANFQEGKSYRDLKEDWNTLFERRFLTWILSRSDGNISRAAREADMDRKYLHKLLKKHAVDPTSV